MHHSQQEEIIQHINNPSGNVTAIGLMLASVLLAFLAYAS